MDIPVQLLLNHAGIYQTSETRHVYEQKKAPIEKNRRGCSASIEDVNLRRSFDYSLVNFSTLSNKGSFQTKWL